MIERQLRRAVETEIDGHISAYQRCQDPVQFDPLVIVDAAIGVELLRGGLAMRRDDGTGVDGRGLEQATAVRGSVGVEGSRDSTQERAAAIRSAY